MSLSPDWRWLSANNTCHQIATKLDPSSYLEMGLVSPSRLPYPEIDHQKMQ